MTPIDALPVIALDAVLVFGTGWVWPQPSDFVIAPQDRADQSHPPKAMQRAPCLWDQSDRVCATDRSVKPTAPCMQLIARDPEFAQAHAGPSCNQVHATKYTPRRILGVRLHPRLMEHAPVRRCPSMNVAHTVALIPCIVKHVCVQRRIVHYKSAR